MITKLHLYAFTLLWELISIGLCFELFKRTAQINIVEHSRPADIEKSTNNAIFALHNFQYGKRIDYNGNHTGRF